MSNRLLGLLDGHAQATRANATFDVQLHILSTWGCRYHRQPRYLTDIVRCRVYVEDIQSIVQFVKALHSNTMLKICFLKNRIDDEYDAKKSFGFRDLQLNLEAGWSNGKIVPKSNWESQSAHMHVCEVQVMFKSFRTVIEKTASGLKWKDVGTDKPAKGRELINDGLKAILQQKTELNVTEWEDCGIDDLRHDDFIEAAHLFFDEVIDFGEDSSRLMVANHSNTESDIIREPVQRYPLGNQSSQSEGKNLQSAMDAIEFRVIAETLRTCRTRKEAASVLGISERTLRYKMARMKERGVEVPKRRTA